MARKKKLTGQKAEAGEAGKPLDIRSRVRELRHVPARELLANPANCRAHPSYQREVMRGLLQEVGYVDALLARETPAGLELLDGHMRAEETPEATVSVLIVDLTDEEAEKVLLTFDPIAAMASANDAAVGRLLDKVHTDNADVRRLLADIRGEKEEREKVPEPTEEETQADVPGMALEPHEHYDYLVVLCTTVQEWNVLCELLELEPVERRGSIGRSRAMLASTLLTKLQQAR